LVVRYDNPTADTLSDVMGIMGGLFAPDDSRRWPAIDPQDSTYAADLRLLSPDQLPEGQAGAPAALAPNAMTHRSGASGGRPVWQPVLLGSLSVVLTGFADEEVRLEVQRSGGPDARETGVAISQWSPPLALGIGAGLLGVGLGAHHPALARTGRDALVAMGVAGLLTTAAKIAVGRARPDANLGTAYFAPFRSPTHDNSFPSGHTSQAFALAAVIAAHTRQPVLRFTVYGAAAVVGIARVAADRHFASDVVGGAILGTLVGRGVVHHFAAGASRVGLAPMVVPGRVGLALNRRF
jgi:membrane-associated phospholipid phosphatase